MPAIPSLPSTPTSPPGHVTGRGMPSAQDAGAAPAAGSPPYPRLIRRVRALIIDSVLIPVAALAALVAGDALGATGAALKLLLFTVPILLLEPVMVSLTGGTVGHHLSGIKVTRRNGTGRLGLAAATVRFIVRLSCGWLSLLLVFTTRQRQALHDLAAGSIVTLRDADALPPYEVLPENRIEEAGYRYPARWQRTIAIVLYCFATMFVHGALLTLALSEPCLLDDRCGGVERFALLAANVLLLAALAIIIVLGWKAQLYGCRRKPLVAG